METKLLREVPSKLLLIKNIKEGHTFIEKGKEDVILLRISGGSVDLSSGKSYIGDNWVYGKLTLVECGLVLFREVE